jgi:diacylglycerol kinase
MTQRRDPGALEPGILAELARIRRSFRYASEGLLHAIHAERHVRFHLFAAVGVLSGAVAFRVQPFEKIALLIVICLVLSFEILNTAVERLADFSGQHDALLKAAKDTAAAAVLVMSFGAVAVGADGLLPRLLRLAAADELSAPYVVDRLSFGFYMVLGILGSLLLYWQLRRWGRVRQVALVASSLAAGFLTAWLTAAGRDPSTPWVILVLQALLLNGFARSDAGRKRRPDLPYELWPFKLIVPCLLLGAGLGGLAGFLWVPGVADTFRRIFG